MGEREERALEKGRKVAAVVLALSIAAIGLAGIILLSTYALKHRKAREAREAQMAEQAREEQRQQDESEIAKLKDQRKQLAAEVARYEAATTNQPATTVAAVTSQTPVAAVTSQAPVEAEAKKPRGLREAVTRIAAAHQLPAEEDKVVTLQKQNADLRDQVADMQKKLEAANKAVRPADKAVTAPVAPTRSSQAIMRAAVEREGKGNDMVMHVWSGRTAVIHELNGEREADVVQPRNDPPAPEVKYTNFDLENANEKALQLKDQVKRLRNEIRDAGCSSARMKSAEAQESSPDMKRIYRRSIQEDQDRIAETQERLTETTAELGKANADVIRISRTLANQPSVH